MNKSNIYLYIVPLFATLSVIVCAILSIFNAYNLIATSENPSLALNTFITTATLMGISCLFCLTFIIYNFIKQDEDINYKGSIFSYASYILASGGISFIEFFLIGKYEMNYVNAFLMNGIILIIGGLLFLLFASISNRIKSGRIINILLMLAVVAIISLLIHAGTIFPETHNVIAIIKPIVFALATGLMFALSILTVKSKFDEQ